MIERGKHQGLVNKLEYKEVERFRVIFNIKFL